MSKLWSFTRRFGIDALIALAAVESAVEIAARHDAVDAPRTTPWFAAPAVAALMLPLLARRRLPFLAPAALWLAAAALSFVDGRLVVFPKALFVAGMLAAFLLGNLRDAVQARFGGVIAVGAAAVVVYNSPDWTRAELVSTPVVFALGWLAGFALQERVGQVEAAEARAAQAEREREAAARIAVAEERARIARELHDVVAHAVSVMVLQAGAVRHRLPEALAEDAQALRGVEQTGRAALTEMRRLLGAMRSDGDDVDRAPQPGLGALESLLEEVRRAGLPVEAQVEQAPFPLPRAIDLSAYRIVQEGLTNVLKHAGATRAEVLVRYGAGGLRIEVRDDGRGTSFANGPGHGLIGIRERVKIYGGEMSAGAAPGGGFVLSASLPLASDAP